LTSQFKIVYCVTGSYPSANISRKKLQVLPKRQPGLNADMSGGLYQFDV